MSSAFSSLPDDADRLRALVIEQAERNAQLAECLQETSARNTYLEARVLTLHRVNNAETNVRMNSPPTCVLA